MLLVYLYACVVGLAVGSFLNVVILRTCAGKPITGRSGCPHCGERLRWYELVPVLSYLVQVGRCRSCKKHISIQYPLVEIATAVAFLLVVAKFPFGETTTYFTLEATNVFALIASLVAWSTLITITVYDLKTKLIPDLFSIVFGLASLVTGLLTLPSYSAETVGLHLAAGPLLALPFALLWIVSKGRWLGLGDAKFAVGIGWLLGYSGGLAAVMLAFWVGALVGLALVCYHKLSEAYEGALAHLRRLFVRGYTITMKSEVPFAPFLAFGTLAAYALSLNAWKVVDAIGHLIFPF